MLSILLGIGWSNRNAWAEASGGGSTAPFIMAMIRPESDYLGRWWRLVYTEIFRRLDRPIAFVDYPPKRASIEADEGAVDGEPGRIYEYLRDHPRLIRVEEPLFTLNFSAFAVSDAIPMLKSWEDLRGSSFQVAYNRGIKICEINLPRVVDSDHLSSLTEPVQGISKLLLGRIDLYIDEESGVLTLLQSPDFKGRPVRLVGVMASVPVYPYVHNKHAALVPGMLDVLRKMKAEGLIDQYRQAVEAELGISRNKATDPRGSE